MERTSVLHFQSVGGNRTHHHCARCNLATAHHCARSSGGVTGQNRKLRVHDRPQAGCQRAITSISAGTLAQRVATSVDRDDTGRAVTVLTLRPKEGGSLSSISLSAISACVAKSTLALVASRTMTTFLGSRSRKSWAEHSRIDGPSAHESLHVAEKLAGLPVADAVERSCCSLDESESDVRRMSLSL